MIKQLELVNRSGHTLRGILDFPDEKDTAPVLVHIHGFGGTKTGYKPAQTHMGRALAANGIACVRFDMYGNGDSDGEFSDMTFTSLLEDTEDIFNWARAQPWAKADNMIDRKSVV